MASEMLRDSFLKLVESMRPMIVNAGTASDTVDVWISNATTELTEVNKHMYVNVSVTIEGRSAKRIMSLIILSSRQPGPWFLMGPDSSTRA